MLSIFAIELTRKLKMSVKYVTNESGDKTDVIIPFSDYLELLEEMEDLKCIAERKNEELISHSDVSEFIFDYERI